jgi:uncharacterized protein YegL
MNGQGYTEAEYRIVDENVRSYDEIVPRGQQVPFDMRNPDPRVPAILLCDTSGSMDGQRIAELNKLVRDIHQGLLNDHLGSVRVELAVVEFNSSARIVHDFALAKDFVPRQLVATGLTAMGSAINEALDLLEARKGIYRQTGTEYYRPWLIILTDGGATDSTLAATQRLQDYKVRKKVVWVPFVIGNSPDAFRTLYSMTNLAIPFNEGEWHKVIAYLLEQFRSVSQSQPADNVGPSSPEPVVDQNLMQKMFDDFTSQ